MNNIRVPNVTRPVVTRDLPPNRDINGTGEFGKVLDSKLGQVKEPLKLSAHASQRLQERNISVDSEMLSKVSEAVDRAEAKGVDDTLILTPDAAFIVSVKNRTIITAMDRNNLANNVFTNIDGAIVVS